MSALLTLRFADRPARRFTLDDDRAYVAGRAPDCDLRADDDRVSRHHVRFECRGGAWHVTDVGSKNGLRVDGRPVAGTASLPERCWLGLGGLVARFERLTPEQLRALEARDRERWQTTFDLGPGLDPRAGLPRLLDQVLRSVLRLSGAERAYALLARGDGGFEVAASAGAGLEGGRFAGSAGVVERALSDGAPVVTCDALDDAALARRPSVSGEGIRALVCVPLEVSGRRLGAVYADSRAPGSAFTELDVEILQALAGQAALAIAVTQLSRETEDVVAELPTRWTDGAAPSAS
jgi:hypothetical protein